MKRFHEQFYIKAKSVRLRDAEKRELRERLMSYMEYHPVSQSAFTQVQQTQAARIPAAIRSHTSLYMKSFFGVTALLLFVIVPVMAERSVPGDILYSVKVGFNEEVRSTVTRSPYEKVEWEVERISRRLAEAQALSREGLLTEEQESRVAAAVRSHGEAARESIERLRDNDADDAAMAELALSVLYDVHSAVLSAHRATGSTMEIRASELAEVVARGRDELERREQSGDRPSYERLLARIEIETAHAYGLFAQTAESASGEDLTSISRRLEDVDRKVQSGIAAHETGEDAQARTLLSEALSTTRKVVTFMENIEIRDSVELDTLIPIEYTKEELHILLEEKLAQLEIRYERVKEQVVQMDEADSSDISRKLDELSAQFASSTGALAADKVEEARDMLGDIDQQLVELEKVLVSEVETEEIPATSTTTPRSSEATSTTGTMSTSTGASTATSSRATTSREQE